MKKQSTTHKGKLEITLTSFVDFVFRVGMAKLNKVDQIDKQYGEGYNQNRDYYKRFRDAVVSIHRNGKSLDILKSLPQNTPEAGGRKSNFEHMVRGYLRFWATYYQEQAPVIKPATKATWVHGDLTIRINPELSLQVGDERHLVKLYLKKEKPERKQVDLILHLMQVALRPKVARPVIVLVDVRRGRAYEATSFKPRLSALLEGEAAAFVQMVKSLNAMRVFEDYEEDAEF